MSVPAISADDENTWPDQLRSLLAASLPELLGYEAFNSDLLDRYLQGDGEARYSPPTNPHEKERQRVLRQADVITARHSLLAFHCTRLLPGEIRLVFGQGLVPLSPAFLEAKIASAVNDRHLTAVQAQEISASMLTDDTMGKRNGMTWLIFTRKTLTNEGGTWRFFTFWGGEAIYILQQDKPLGNILKKIGTPCIVEVQIPIAHIPSHRSVGERLICCYLHHREVKQEHGTEWEGNIQAGVHANHIRDIIQRSDPRFEPLTQCNSWRQPI